MAIKISAKKQTNRLKYTLNLIFNNILGIDYQLVDAQNIILESNDIWVHYGNEKPANCHLLLKEAPNSLIFEKTIYSHSDVLAIDNNPISLFTWEKINYDYLSTVFFLATEYEFYTFNDKDQFGRVDEKKSLRYLKKWYLQPYCNIYAELIYNQLIKINPLSVGKLKNKNRSSSKFTIDIDHPYRYLYKPLYVTAPALIRDILKLDFSRLNALINRKDPYDVYHRIFEFFPAEKTIFFILINGNNKKDDFFYSSNSQFCKLIRYLKEKGCEIGIHPSFDSALDHSLILKQKEALEQIINCRVKSSRQHFLKYYLPSTFSKLIEYGIEDEFSGAWSSVSGFKHGMANSFPWFNLIEDKETSLTLHPTQTMDRTFLNNGFTVENAKIETQMYYDLTKKYGGEYVFLLHNDSLSDFQEWEGWTQYWHFLQKLACEKEG